MTMNQEKVQPRVSQEDLKRAGRLTAHIEVIGRLRDLRELLKAAQVMGKQNARAVVFEPESATMFSGGQAPLPLSQDEIKICFRLLKELKGFEAEDYTVNTAELKALNERAVLELRDSDALVALVATLSGEATQEASHVTAADEHEAVMTTQEGEERKAAQLEENQQATDEQEGSRAGSRSRR